MADQDARNPDAKGLLLDLEAPSPPFDYNASTWSQRVPICVLATVGAVIAAYMGLYQWGLIHSVWDPFFGSQTEKVLKSQTSQTMERYLLVPDAILGSVAYLGDAIYGLAGSTRRWQLRPWMTVLFGLDVIPLGVVSAVLVFMQGAVVGAWCSLCIFTAFISLALVYFAYDEVWACLNYLRFIWNNADSSTCWKVFWGGASEHAAVLAFAQANADEQTITRAQHVAASR